MPLVRIRHLGVSQHAETLGLITEFVKCAPCSPIATDLYRSKYCVINTLQRSVIAPMPKPPITPYVIMRTVVFFANEESMNPREEHSDPKTSTLRKLKYRESAPAKIPVGARTSCHNEFSLRGVLNELTNSGPD